MKLSLKDFQDDGVRDLAVQSKLARAEVEAGGKSQTLVLAAPTGSGKTVMATEWMERIVDGAEDLEADPNATFLWLTDQPELNEQTRRKMEATSTVFGSDDIEAIESDFDQEALDPGRVYLLNTQKLGKGTKLVTSGDKRSYPIWETLANTAADRPGSFWVVIDEAHRGTAQTRREREIAQTIVQKFVLGSSGDGLPESQLILGISATPDRFLKLVEGTTRINRPVTISPEDVRASGLLKDAITLYHPQEKQPSDLTLLRAAAEQVTRYASDWAEYADKEKAPEVEPLLVVQVEDAGAKSISKTDIAECIKVIDDALGQLDPNAFAHSFQESYNVVVGGDRSLRYVAPADIQEDESVKVVFFKQSLNTGWDCPRAETMMSFRKQVDPTVIAQLMGRMIRTPLARRVGGNDFLNSVCLYLPYYDEDAVTSVIEYLTEPDPEESFPTTVQRGEKLVTLKRNPDAQTVFDAAAELETYVIERVSKQSATRRLLRLGRLLAWDKLDEDALTTYTEALVAVLDKERKKIEGKDSFKKAVQEAAQIDVRGVTVGYGQTEPQSETTSKLKAVAQNVDHAFAEAGRKLGGGLHSAYLRHRAAEEDAPPVATLKLELYALTANGGVVEQVEKTADDLLSEELEKHKAAVMKLPEDRRHQYRQIRRQAKRPSPEPWELPETIEIAKNGKKKYPKHLYTANGGSFSCTLNKWEQQVIEGEIAKDEVVAWLRNEPRKPWAFAIPYSDGKEDRPLFPDFLVFRQQGDGIVCDVLEPHSLDWQDSPAKAVGLAEFASELGDRFGHIELIAKVGKELKRLRLDDIDTRDKVRGVKTGEHLRQLFEVA